MTILKANSCSIGRKSGEMTSQTLLQPISFKSGRLLVMQSFRFDLTNNAGFDCRKDHSSGFSRSLLALYLNHGGEIARRHRVHVRENQFFGEVTPVSFFILFAHDGKLIEDVGRVVAGETVEVKEQRVQPG